MARPARTARRFKDEKKEVNGKRRAETPVEESEEEVQQEEHEEPDNEMEQQDVVEYEEVDDDEEQEAGSPRGNKRRRVNGDGDSVLSVADDEDGQPEPAVSKVKTLPRGADGYIPGSIVRIQLCNFVTYDFVEFTPGPYLNMIVGPNGTGKSTIACAIALGLNFPPAILGRATDLHSFVKNGTESGYIEIELKGAKGSNLVIRRNLKSTSRGSTFTLNGQSATGTEIKGKMTQLNVQVGNLCSFLPQDKVSQFAQMTPQQLLRETQRAAGDVKLTTWHDVLIETGKELSSLQATIVSEEKTLNQQKERNEGIKKDVQRYHERKKIEHEIALLDLLIPVARYRDIRLKFLEAKATQRRLHAKVKRLQQKNEPAHALLRKLEENYKHAEEERDSLKKSTQAKFQKLTTKNQASDKLDQDSNDIIEKLANLKKEERDRLKQIGSLEVEVARLQAELSKPPPDLPSEEQVREEYKHLNLEKNALGSRIDEFNGMMRQCADKKAAYDAEYTKVEKKLNALDNVDVQKLQAMERWDKDTHDAILWVRNNRDKFRMEVFETPFMRLTVRDKRFIHAVEACFNANQMKAFVAQCQEDVDTLNRCLNEENGTLGRRVRVVTWFRPTAFDTLVPPPMSPEEMMGHHFDGYALDFIDCPEGMKHFLMRDVNLHRTAIALNGQGIDVNSVMGLVARPIPDFHHPGGANFITGRTINTVNRSRYGRKAISNMTREYQDARNLLAPSIDLGVKRKIEEELREAQLNIGLAEEEKAEVKRNFADIGEQKQVVEQREAGLQRKKQAIANEAKLRISAQTRLDSRKKSLKALMAKPPADTLRANLKAKLVTNNQKRMAFAQQYMDLVQAIVHEQAECTRIGLHYLQLSANRIALQELCDRKDIEHQNALRQYTQANEKFQVVKAQSKEILEESRRVLGDASDEVREEYNQIEEVRLQYEKEEKEASEQGLPLPDKSAVDCRTVEELRTELETQKAKLELSMGTNPAVIREYEARQKHIETLESTLTERRTKEEKYQRNIKNAQDNWQPALQKLVDSIGSKFSAAFDRIGCAGEIRINENEDFDKWAIDILVKFRDSEKLQLLTAHRQSGGERSLTTILYLMSLTEEARAPFSLVDEINQGMDHRAERVVHNSMVNVTCKPDSAQYFLITPKLLPDLEYHERMKVLCVNNGEWLPEKNVSGRMMNMIDSYVRRPRTAGANQR